MAGIELRWHFALVRNVCNQTVNETQTMRCDGLGIRIISANEQSVQSRSKMQIVGLYFVLGLHGLFTMASPVPREGEPQLFFRRADNECSLEL